MMEFSRVFHTVGQGAFYSEEIVDERGTRLRVVYDCGSSTLKNGVNGKLHKRIKSDFAKNCDVDILFISHFDADHINGVKFLRPKVIIIPFLSVDYIHIQRIRNQLNQKLPKNTRDGVSFDVDFESKLRKWFPKVPVIKIKPNLEDGEDLDDNGDSYWYNASSSEVNTLRRQREIDSGSQVVMAGIGIQQKIWEYVVFNPNMTKYVDKFKNELILQNIDWNQLVARNNGQYIISNLDKLRDVYKRLKGMNSHSLVVYSGEGDFATYYIPELYWIPMEGQRNGIQRTALYSVYGRWCYCPYRAGCIYFGDAEISVWIDIFYKKLTALRMNRVSTIQIPHHGSANNNSIEIFDNRWAVNFSYSIAGIISVGETNPFGHPSADLLKTLTRFRVMPYLVTESASTVFIRTWQM